MLLTSHYMRDVEALCDRVLVITNGTLVYDGPLSGITDHVWPVQTGPAPVRRRDPRRTSNAMAKWTRREGPTVDLKVDRAKVAEVLAAILDLHVVDDVSVTDPPSGADHRPGLRGGATHP